MNIFDYDNSHDFLKDFIALKSKHGEVSLRKISSDLTLDHTVLSRVLNGKRELPVHVAETLGKKIGLESIELEYFLMLTEINHVSTKWAKNLLINEAKQIRTQRTLPKLSQKSFEITADLTTFTILYLLEIDGIDFTPQNISNLLDINQDKVERSISRLTEAGILINDDHGYRIAQKRLNFKINNANKSVEKYFKEVLDRSKKELDFGEASKRVFRTRISAIPSHKRKEITTMIDGFLGKLAVLMKEWEDEDLKNDEVVCLNINFFGLLNHQYQKRSTISPH